MLRASGSALAAPAASCDFHCALVGFESALAGGVAELLVDDLAMHFIHVTAVLADQELAEMRVIRMLAADKGVQRFQLVDEAFGKQKFQRPIHGRRRYARPIGAQHFHDVVRAHRLVAGIDDGQHLAPLRRQAHATFATQLFGQCHGAGGFGVVGHSAILAGSDLN